MKNPYLVTIGVMVFLVAASFYWFQWRPSDIRKNCSLEAKGSAIVLFKNKLRFNSSFTEEEKQSIDKETYSASDEKDYYENCLSSRGLKN